MNSLDLLIVVFGGMSVVSVLGVLIQFLIKDERKKKPIFYFLVVWGMVIAFLNAKMNPIYMTGEIVLAFAIGSLSIIALLVQLIGKKMLPAQILVSVSVIAGMIDAFMF